MRPPPTFSDKERDILITIYEDPGSPYDSYVLVAKFNPAIRAGTSAHDLALAEIVTATEELITRGLVRGTRLKSGNRIYFSDLKLKYKGEQAAIQERKRVAEFKKLLPEIIKESDKVSAEINKFNDKK
jgi:hypothetical protein